MRIGSIQLSWFRGAAKDAILETGGASLLVYGLNGAGKSSFVDAVEVCVRSGKLNHLSHEYSGRHQEKGLINTHRPFGQATTASVAMAKTGAIVTCRWAGAGAVKIEGLNASRLDRWDYRRIALRQEEVADFIRSTKAEKYSALVPLLGLQSFETAAENLRRIAKEIATLSKVEDLRRQIASIQDRRKEAFGEASVSTLLDQLRALCSRYLSDPAPDNSAQAAIAVKTAIEQRVSTLDAESREAAALQEVAGTKLQSLIQYVQEIDAEIAQSTEPLLMERLETLSAAARYTQAQEDVDEVNCPACGTIVKLANFRAHVVAEREKLQQIEAMFRKRSQSLNAVFDEVQRLRTLFASAILASWRVSKAAALVDEIRFLQEIDIPSLRIFPQDTDLVRFATEIKKIVDVVNASEKLSTPDVNILINDKVSVALISDVLEAEKNRKKVERTDALIGYTNTLEEMVREEIREQAEAVFGTISTDIQRLWHILVPSQEISDMRLYVPDDADRGIDVALSFHGIEQDSPRLTLSEGRRNALGLCIFLALAKQVKDDTPIILDDVVISMDRGHRSQVAMLLEKEFADRQIILLTHDREWFFELTRFLKKPRWKSARLVPWGGPTTGIRIADQSEDFAKARANINVDPEDAESNVRRIMDQAMAETAERLEVPMPFLRGDDNDHRTAGQFISRVTGRAKKGLHIKSDSTGAFEKHVAAVAALDLVAPQLAAWANRGTHTFSASPTEAAVLIDNCEAALAAFQCSGCQTPVWFLEIESSGHLECRCGGLQWRRQ